MPPPSRLYSASMTPSGCVFTEGHSAVRQSFGNICLWAVCIYIWPPVLAIWMALLLDCCVAFAMGISVLIETCAMCARVGSVSFFLASSRNSEALGFTVQWVTGQAHFPCASHPVTQPSSLILFRL